MWDFTFGATAGGNKQDKQRLIPETAESTKHARN